MAASHRPPGTGPDLGHKRRPPATGPKPQRFLIARKPAGSKQACNSRFGYAKFLATQGSRTVTRLWEISPVLYNSFWVSFRDAASPVNGSKRSLQLAAIAIYAYLLMGFVFYALLMGVYATTLCNSVICLFAYGSIRYSSLFTYGNIRCSSLQ